MKIGVVGLGYVGLPLAIAFGKKFSVVGYDVSEKKIRELKSKVDSTNEVSKIDLEGTDIFYTNDPSSLKECDFVIVAVPTPVNKAKIPDLKYVESASRDVAKNMKSGCIVVFESTVYPGVTEDVCIPILEKDSGMKCGKDFKIGYSPERINPGDKNHTLHNTVKIVSGMDEDSLNKIADLYSSIIEAGVYKAPTIKTAEASKIIENIQRDVNIGLMNEVSLIFRKLGIDTFEVLKAARTKWNFNNYYPGLVGGHCIGVDPYYLILKSEELGHHPQLISSARRINDYMAKSVAEMIIRSLREAHTNLSDSNVYLLGLTFKENVNDYRNSKVEEIIEYLKHFGIEPFGVDPNLTGFEVESFGIRKKEISEIRDADCVAVLVPHKEFLEIDLRKLKDKMRGRGLIDLRQSFDKKIAFELGFDYYSL